MEGTQQFNGVLSTPDVRIQNGQREQSEQRTSMSEMQLAMERFQAMRDAGASTRKSSYWILGNR